MERFGITAAGQMREMLLFCAVGVGLGVWYEVFRVVRLLGHPTAWRVFWQDIAAAGGAACITLLAALPISQGEIRGVHLVCLLLGAVVYYVLAGKVIYRALRYVIGVFRRKCTVFERKRKKLKKTFKKHLQQSGDV